MTKVQTSQNPPILIPLEDTFGRVHARIKLMEDLIGSRRAFTDEEGKELAALKKQLTLEDFEKEMGVL